MRNLSLVIVMVVMPLAAASAATLTVNTRADNTTVGDGQCTLREAIANVNAAADTTSGDCAAGTGSGDTVVFNLRLPAKIKLTLGQLTVGQDVSIVGPTTGALRISGARASRVLRIAAGATSISDLTIEHGKSDAGGGILNEGTLTLTNCMLKSNQSSTGGGAIANHGTATLVDCTFKGNKAQGGGAGISNNGGTLTATNCTFRNNSTRFQGGGGIANYAIATLTNCTLKGNTSVYGAGGGVLNLATATLTNCTLNANKAFAGIGGLGGGGIWHYSGGGGTATLINTIVAKNGGAGNCGGDAITSAGHNLSTDSNCFTSGGTDLVNTDPMLARLANYGGPTETVALCSAAGMPRASCSGASPAIDAGDDAVIGPPDNLTTDQRGLPRLAGAHVDIGAYEVQ